MVDVSLLEIGLRYDDALQADQHEVQRLLGRCLLQLQQYERLIKAMIADQAISGAVHALETFQTKRKADTARKTLGALVNDLLGSYLVTNEIGTPDEETTSSSEGVNSFVMRLYLELSDADFSRTETERDRPCPVIESVGGINDICL
jgi:hypothetical protein